VSARCSLWAADVLAGIAGALQLDREGIATLSVRISHPPAGAGTDGFLGAHATTGPDCRFTRARSGPFIGAGSGTRVPLAQVFTTSCRPERWEPERISGRWPTLHRLVARTLSEIAALAAELERIDQEEKRLASIFGADTKPARIDNPALGLTEDKQRLSAAAMEVADAAGPLLAYLRTLSAEQPVPEAAGPVAPYRTDRLKAPELPAWGRAIEQGLAGPPLTKSRPGSLESTVSLLELLSLVPTRSR